MTETMFARAAAPKSSLGLATILVILVTLVGGVLTSVATPPRAPPGAPAPTEPAPAAQVDVTNRS